MTVPWRGVFPAATTQFHADQSLDLQATLHHLDSMIAAGVHGMIMLGTVGENCSLEYGEKLDVLRATVEHVARPRAGADRRGRMHDGGWRAASRPTPRRPASTA